MPSAPPKISSARKAVLYGFLLVVVLIFAFGLTPPGRIMVTHIARQVVTHFVNHVPGPAADAMNGATEVTLYSLETLQPGHMASDMFDGFPMLGKTVLEGAEAKKAITAFTDANEGWNGWTAMCFDPHHALRI